MLRDSFLIDAGNAARRGVRRLNLGVAGLTVRACRTGLRRYARARPRPRAQAPRSTDPQVTILLSSAWGMGGTIRTTLNLAEYLAERHDVEILSVMRRREAPFFVLPGGVKVTALDDQRSGATPRRIRLVRTILRSRPSVLMAPGWRPFPACSLWTDVQLVRRLRRRTGVLIGTHPCLNLVAAELSLPSRSVIGQEHMHLRKHHRSVRKAIVRGYPRLDALVVLTEQDAREFAQQLHKEPRIAVIPNTVRELEGGQAPLTGTTILAAGRLTRQKGFDFLIRAFASIAPQHPDWQLRICGGGPQNHKLQSLIDEQGLADRVALTGPVKNLGAEMQRASLFVLSSRYEGFPLVLVEAMSKGLPVVSFDCPTGPREVIDDHRNGILVPARDVDALASGMQELITDPELRHRLGAAAILSANHYTIAAIGPLWSHLLDDIRRSTGADGAPPDPNR